MKMQYLSKNKICTLVKLMALVIAIGSIVSGCNEKDLGKMISTSSSTRTIDTSEDAVAGPGGQIDSIDDILDVPAAEPVVFPLIAGQHIEVGTVTVTNTQTAIVVVYDTIDGWGITETHVDAALDYSGLHTNRPGNPQPGRFDQQTHHPQPVTRVVHMIEDLDWVAGTPIYIATHAVVTSEQQGTETAWAGDQDFPGNNWATYLSYTTQDIVQDERGKLQFSQSVYEAFEAGRGRTYLVEIEVVRVDGSSGTISADYSVVGGTATYSEDPSLSDYLIDSLQGTLVFPDGVTSQIITIVILDDMEYEVPNETIELELSQSCCLADQTTAIVDITDDEELN
jgi:hypothetical protein